MRNVLLVHETLKGRRVWASGGCPFCATNLETINHLFYTCPITIQVCDVPNVLNIVSLAELMNNTLCGPSLKEVVMMAANMWVIWNTKNDVVWNGVVWFVHGMKR